MSPADGHMASSGSELSASVQRALGDVFKAARGGGVPADRPHLRVVIDREPQLVAWQAQKYDKPIIAVVADSSFITGTFERILAQAPLLPSSLAETQQFLSVRVASSDGRVLFASSPDWSPYHVERALDDDLAGLRLSVALNPSAAERLVIGGLPRDRLPILVGLMLLTAALVAAGMFQLRREHELARLRADFISGVSHELRTPLAQIRLFGETLLLGRVRSEAERQRSLAIIVQESQRLARLIENILHFSRSERSAVSISAVPTRLDLLLHDILDAFTPLATSKRVTMIRLFDDGLTAPVDAAAIRQIMLNLLDNAVKYGPAGQQLTISARYHEKVARVTVEDQGPGVAPEDAARIWQPYYRVAAHAQATGGTGIGLAIVRQLVDLHRGRVWVEPRESGGARFVVELPDAALAEDSTEWPQAVARS